MDTLTPLLPFWILDYLDLYIDQITPHDPKHALELQLVHFAVAFAGWWWSPTWMYWVVSTALHWLVMKWVLPYTKYDPVTALRFTWPLDIALIGLIG